jgi:prephenate dehydratase
VVSHPQALAQCRDFLNERVPQASAEAAGSTAEAVRVVASSDEPLGALGTRLAADLYGCEVLAEAVEDSAENLTRFVWLAPEGTPPHGGPATKTSVVFWGFNDESPGALVGVLNEFAEREVNLTKIESRPRRVQLGHYMFFADLDGGEDDPPVRAALEGLARRVEILKVLGSYPGASRGGERQEHG